MSIYRYYYIDLLIYMLIYNDMYNDMYYKSYLLFCLKVRKVS